MLVRVSEHYKSRDFRGQTGLVQQRYGDDRYATVDVQFGDGRSELFWHHDLEEAQEFNQRSG
jgi:hypothetical protein